jgi:hypothetical protein
MFIRFRKPKDRLQVSLVGSRRVADKVTHVHLASLGSIADPASVYDRLEFWQGFHERLARLGNRVDAADIGKIMAAVHERIPMVTHGRAARAQTSASAGELGLKVKK